MDELKIKHCRQYWESLPTTAKKLAISRHLFTATEIAERLLRENNRLEMENRGLRIESSTPKRVKYIATDSGRD